MDEKSGKRLSRVRRTANTQDTRLSLLRLSPRQPEERYPLCGSYGRYRRPHMGSPRRARIGVHAKVWRHASRPVRSPRYEGKRKNTRIPDQGLATRLEDPSDRRGQHGPEGPLFHAEPLVSADAREGWHPWTDGKAWAWGENSPWVPACAGTIGWGHLSPAEMRVFAETCGQRTRRVATSCRVARVGHLSAM